ncbi:pilin [Vibrio gazogenes]|uniref:Type IV pilus assembly protein PilA n=1 Tax=Vibrio gazogenes DSM 21264 = NBRC 103151 TaxID=1123492 RepID=A0A1M5CLP9_VIBGA|nr:pilin [Vibrio gazogenes]SHF55596.1 type IV pilus assembly protein PilA [Vibrio gazogenes DSM 21264] [Vibrio gazogenes DSM 21264 = NBRC 103151]SJN53700.1 Fimbrial protein precursor [Vibrio gazogenes]
MPSTTSRQLGFTLVELMIVVTIIGILSSIAVPAYHNYIQKSEVTAGVSTTSALTTNIDLFIQENGKFPSATGLSEIGASATMSALGTLSLLPDPEVAEQGVLLFEFNATTSVSGKKVQWQKSATTGWQCIQDAAEHIKGCQQGSIM